MISSMVGLLAGSLFRMRCTRSFAVSVIGTFSGNEYELFLIRLYVVFTSFVSKGGLPMIRV